MGEFPFCLCVCLLGAGEKSTVWSESSGFRLRLSVGWDFDLSREVLMYRKFNTQLT